ncbi:MAG: carboxypeptidase regulatory-like domain-containing protein [bacterium]|nr:carboxypeptidase regulatory-like domain-containing protein [bacterium]
MKNQLKLLPLVITFFLIVVFTPIIQEAQANSRLYGKISLKISGHSKPLGEAKVELRKIAGGGKSYYKTYSDARGNFAFYRIPQGKYTLTVSRGTYTFFQLVKGIKKKKRMVIINNPGKNQRLPEIYVLK